MTLAQRYAQPKKVDPKLIKERKDHTLNAFYVEAELIPYIILKLVEDSSLTLVRAMNYSTLKDNFEKSSINAVFIKKI